MAKTPFTQDQKDQVISQFGSGSTVLEISERLKVDPRRVSGYVRTMINAGKIDDKAKKKAGKEAKAFQPDYASMIGIRLMELGKVMKVAQKAVKKSPDSIQYLLNSLSLMQRLTMDSLDLAARWQRAGIGQKLYSPPPPAFGGRG